MNRTCFQALIFLFLAFSCAEAIASCGSPQARTYVSYRIQPESLDGKPALKVALSFKVENRSAIDLVLPSEWQGTTELYKSIHQMRVISAGSSMGGADKVSRRRISFGAGKPVQLEYLFQPEELSSKSNVTFGPVLNSDYFVLTGRNFLVYPDVPEHDSMPVSLEWVNFPAGWTLADGLGVNDLCQRGNTLLKLSNGLFIGGDFRLQKSALPSPQVYLGIRGKWQFDDTALAELAAKVIAAERQFWDDRSMSNYLVVLTPQEAPPGEYGGTAVEGGFLMFMSPGTQFSFDVQFLFAHEAFHSWNPAQLGEINPKHPIYWFSEGFTDYYARLFLLRASFISPQQYADDINRIFSEYMSSPARNYGEQRVQAQYFSDPPTQRLPYLQGTLLALKWNAIVDERSHGHQSLDNAMRLLRERAQASDQILSEQNLATFFADFVGSGVIADIRDYVEFGKTMPLPPQALGPCFRLEKKVLYTFNAGFDVDAIYRNGIIQGVEQGSEAYKAGLRDGQSVLRSSGINPNDANQAVEISVVDSGQLKQIRYFPRESVSQIDQYQFTEADTHCEPATLH
jgi:predicted metalloprotease with PDZ domain